MLLSLTDRWTSWWQAHEASSTSSSSSPNLHILPLRFVERVVLADLKKDGYDVPSSRKAQEVLEQDLEPLGEHQSFGKPQKLCTLVNVLNMLWQPILEYIEGISTGQDKPWTSNLTKHQD